MKNERSKLVRAVGGAQNIGNNIDFILQVSRVAEFISDNNFHLYFRILVFGGQAIETENVGNQVVRTAGQVVRTAEFIFHID